MLVAHLVPGYAAVVASRCPDVLFELVLIE
jgi:hypothetical protein